MTITSAGPVRTRTVGRPLGPAANRQTGKQQPATRADQVERGVRLSMAETREALPHMRPRIRTQDWRG